MRRGASGWAGRLYWANEIKFCWRRLHQADFQGVPEFVQAGETSSFRSNPKEIAISIKLNGIGRVRLMWDERRNSAAHLIKPKMGCQFLLIKF